MLSSEAKVNEAIINYYNEFTYKIENISIRRKKYFEV